MQHSKSESYSELGNGDQGKRSDNADRFADSQLARIRAQNQMLLHVMWSLKCFGQSSHETFPGFSIGRLSLCKLNAHWVQWISVHTARWWYNRLSFKMARLLIRACPLKRLTCHAISLFVCQIWRRNARLAECLATSSLNTLSDVWGPHCEVFDCPHCEAYPRRPH